MISQFFIKDSKPQDLLIQFSTLDLPYVFNQFQKILKQEKIPFRKSKMPENILNFYIVDKRKNIQYQGVSLQSLPNLTFQLCIVYLWGKQMEELGISIQSQKKEGQKKPKRFLVIREGMDKLFSIDYEIQETISQKQTGLYLCQLSGFLINNIHDKKIGFYDKKSDELQHDKTKSMYTNVWKNILYQIPGLGKQKVQSIVKKFPTYSSLIKDYEGQQKLINLQILRGGKNIKLGSILANRIYKVINSLNISDTVV